MARLPKRIFRRPAHKVAAFAALDLLILAASLPAALGGHAWAAAALGGLTLLAVLQSLVLRGSIRQRDPLTGLRQRDGLVRALERAIRDSGREDGCAALVLEIEDSRQLEERYDRPAFDTMLVDCARRMRTIVREGDVVARLDGTLFAVALAPAPGLNLEATLQLAQRLQAALSAPIALGGQNRRLTASVGFALSGRTEHPGAERLLQAALIALFEAQRHGPGAVRSYSRTMRQRIARRHELSTAVARALEDGEITAHFQPQVDSRSGRLTGVETLARWCPPGRPPISPGEFLPVLEDSGLLPRFGERMLELALAALGRWDARGYDVPRIAVNFSGPELTEPGLVEKVRDALARHRLEADRLVIEVLETVAAASGDDRVRQTLAGLAALGCAIDLDDFGTGHASITTIRRFSVQRIKIDRSFVTGIDGDRDQQEMVSAILTMAERLGLGTLAEGVETPEERRRLAELGCAHLQGYGIARPMPAEAIEGWVASRRDAPEAVPLLRRA